MGEGAYRKGGPSQDDEPAEEAIGKADQQSSEEGALEKIIVQRSEHYRKFLVSVAGPGRGLVEDFLDCGGGQNVSGLAKAPLRKVQQEALIEEAGGGFEIVVRGKNEAPFLCEFSKQAGK